MEGRLTCCLQTLKKNQVDKHAHTCKSCYAVTCVDCQVVFHGDDYAAHTTCVSEAEKYEKSLFRPKTGAKPKAQDVWNALVEDIVSMKSQAPAQVQPYLERLSSLNNVPRNQKKFINFARNSLNIRSDGLLESLWKFMDTCRVQKEGESEAASSSAATQAVDAPAAVPPTATEEGKSKKEKRKRDDEVEEVKEHIDEVVKDDEGKKKKKKKDKSNDKEDEAPAAPVEVEETVDKKEKKVKKEKKEKKDKH